jgi:glycosyltransferase involved in cell wall biosynthesis
MSRVGKFLPLVVVAPVPWFPFLGLIRLARPNYRPAVPYFESQDGIDVYHPRFLSIPGYLKFLDGLLQAICTLPTLLRIRKEFDFDIIDAHFVYPDGVAAHLLSRWLNRPYTVTLRGQIEVISRTRLRRRLSLAALRRAARVFSVAESLRQGAVRMGETPEHIRVVGNGVDSEKFTRENRPECRARLGLPLDAPVLVSVGGLTERKGFHRVIEVLPDLRRRFTGLRLVIAGGASPEGDWEKRLKRQVAELGISDAVHFLGPVSPSELRFVYSAGDVFVLATRMEGWANVFLEAMACGLPVVSTLVGGNAEVVNAPELGILVPYGDGRALHDALSSALNRRWDSERIMRYARANSWDARIPVLIDEFRRIHSRVSAISGGHADGRAAGDDQRFVE